MLAPRRASTPESALAATGPDALPGTRLPAEELHHLVSAEQVRMLYRQLPVSISGTLISSVLLLAVLWEILPRTLLVGWFVVVHLNQAIRLALYLHFLRHGMPLHRYREWGRYWAIGATVSGVLWGTAGVLFFVPESALHQTILLITIFAMTGTGVALLASHAPSFYGFLIPTVIPIMLRNAWEGDALHWVIAFIVLAMTLSIMSVHARSRAMIIESLRNRYRNIELVAELQARNVELEEAREVAERASRSKTQFFAAASHDLRQPLHAMGLFAGALSERARDPDVLQLVHSINASVDALDSLFNELLDISKIDAGVVRPGLVHFPLQRVFDRIVLEFEPEAAEKQLRLLVHPCSLHVHSDPLLLERILRNLVTNAIRYTHRGGVLIGWRKREDRLTVEVWDTGTGIPADQCDRIFDEFYQLANPERSSRKGMGLGLSIVKRLCQLLDHPIRVSSRPGRGSVFRFDVPLGTPEARAPVGEPLAPPAPGSLAGRVFVVIDDEESVVSGMRVLLEGWGARVFGGATGAEIVAALQAAGARPDLLICDLHLQNDSSGFDEIDRLRERYGRSLPAILVTGSAAPEHAETARSRHLHFLLKPVNPAKLRTLINFKLQQRVPA